MPSYSLIALQNMRLLVQISKNCRLSMLIIDNLCLCNQVDEDDVEVLDDIKKNSKKEEKLKEIEEEEVSEDLTKKKRRRRKRAKAKRWRVKTKSTSSM